MKRTLTAVLGVVILGAVAAFLVLSRPASPAASRTLAEALGKPGPGVGSVVAPAASQAPAVQGQAPADETVCYTDMYYTRPEPDPAELDARIRDAGGTDRPVLYGYAGSAEGLADYRDANHFETSKEGRTADLVIETDTGQLTEQWMSSESELGETVWMRYESHQEVPCPEGV